jgi:hypothetical protein
MKKQASRLEAITPNVGMTLTVNYSNGCVLQVDLTDLANRLQSFAALENPQEFSTTKVTDFGWTVEWNRGASLDSDRLIERALEQAGMTENASFRRTLPTMDPKSTS